MDFVKSTGFVEEFEAAIALVEERRKVNERTKKLWEPVSTELASVFVRAKTLAAMLAQADPSNESTNQSFFVPEDFDSEKVASALLSVTGGIKRLAQDMRQWSDGYSINDVCNVLGLVEGFVDELKYAFRDHPGFFETVINWLGL